jgi:hypothetical protein
VEGLASLLQKWWRGDPVATAAVENFSKDPKRYGNSLSGLLASDLVHDKSLAAELRKLLDNLGPQVEVIQKMEIARGVTGADIRSLVRGTVRVEQDFKSAKDSTGVKIDKVGGE